MNYDNWYLVAKAANLVEKFSRMLIDTFKNEDTKWV